MTENTSTNKSTGLAPVGKAPRLLSDEADLRWFFGVGQSAFERSTFGAQLEIAERLGFTSDGERVESPKERERRSWRYRQSECGKLRVKAGHHMRDMLDELRDLLDEQDMLTEDPSETARGQDPKKGELGYEPDDKDLQRYARISRTLSRMLPSHRRALGLFFGLRAARWSDHDLGRLLMLYGETQAGRELLARHPEREGRPDDKIAQEWTDQRAWKDPERGKLLTRCREQATGLYLDAMRGYVAARAD